MHINEIQYIIRNRAEQALTSPSMPCHEVIKAAKSGYWGTDCLIDEVYILEREIPRVLRRVAAFLVTKGFR